MNGALMVSDGLNARIGALGAGREWFKPWRTISGETLSDSNLTELQVMLEGVCQPERFLALLRDFIVFEDDGSGKLVKKMAGYHQFHAVRVAVGETIRAAEFQRDGGISSGPIRGRHETGRQPGGAPGDHRIGVVWHTQGSGKSLTMAFYAGAIVREPAMQNPTIVVLTDRNDLDDQLFTTFSPLPRPVAPAPSAGGEPGHDLRDKLSVASGGVVFTPPSRSFSPRSEATPTLPCRSGATSWSSPTRPTAASTTSSTASPATCATLCPMPPSSASPAPP